MNTICVWSSARGEQLALLHQLEPGRRDFLLDDGGVDAMELLRVFVPETGRALWSMTKKMPPGFRALNTLR